MSDRFDNALDFLYGEVTIAGQTFSTSRAYKELDPIGYRTGECNYHDGLCEDGDHESDYIDGRDEYVCVWCDTQTDADGNELDD